MKKSSHLIAGLGKTGLSVARYLANRQISFAVFDTRENPPGLAELHQSFADTPCFLGQIPPDLQSVTEIIASPGFALDHPLIQKARQAQIPIVGDIEYLARELNAYGQSYASRRDFRRGGNEQAEGVYTQYMTDGEGVSNNTDSPCAKRIVAITGTNGKSTVTTLVGEMAKAAGLNVAVAGNIGLPVLDLVDTGQSFDLWVLELSSFQLEGCYSLCPTVATILNLSPDHLDHHQHLEAYAKAKQRIYHRAACSLYNRQDPWTYPEDKASRIKSFGLTPPTGDDLGLATFEGEQWLMAGKTPLLPVTALKIKGSQNWENALAAAGLAQAVGIDTTAIIKVLSTFEGLPHRCQLVRTIDGVEWINDSKGTNVGATISAITGIGAAIKGRIVLIAGGLGKGADFSALRSCTKDFVHSAVLIGADAPHIAQALGDLVPIVHTTTFEQAVLKAKALAQPGDTVLLSPACASLDMFRDFNHRGETFAALVHQL